MLKVYLLQGLPASGKSTWAKAEVAEHPGMYKRVNKDELRSMLDAGEWSKDNEKFVLALRDKIILSALDAGKHVIVDDTNLHPKHLEHITELVEGRAVVTPQFFNLPLEECIRRDLKREKSVGEKVIRDMYDQFLAPPAQTIEFDPSLQSAIMCDIDGTLALMNGRSPYDTAKCDNDIVNESTASVVRSYFERGYQVILCSGRKSEFKTLTKTWLGINEISYSLLLMRKDGDTRNDAIVKEELFNEYIRNKYNVLFVLDDRDRVVSKWREMGLTCFQVAKGNF